MRSMILTPLLFACHGESDNNGDFIETDTFQPAIDEAPHSDRVGTYAHTLPKSPKTVIFVGDSITAGVHSTGGKHTYPGQLQLLLDKKYGEGKYAVTNLGACGSTMLKSGDSPYWERPQYKSLVNNTWDIIIIQVRHIFLISTVRKP